MRRHLLLVVALVAAVSLAGCSLFTPPADATASLPNATAAAERYNQLDGLSVTLNATMEHDGATSWSVQRISTRPGTGDFRNVVRAVGPPAAAANRSLAPGSRIVSNGSGRYIYAAGSDTVQRSSVSNASTDRADDIRRLFAELRDDDNGTIRRPTPGIPQLPAVPEQAQSPSGDGNESVRWREDRVTVRYRGTATVAGRSVYVIGLRPATANASLVEATLWLDTEYLYPLKRHTVAFHYGERYEYTSVARNVTLDPDFGPEAFRLDPATLPENVSLARSESYDTRAAMVAALDRPVPDPTVPDRFAFEGGLYSEGADRPTHLSLSYTTADGRESIRLSVFAETGNLSGRQVTVGGHPAAFSTFRGGRYLNWNADGRQYSVSGTVGNATLRRVAASVID